MIKKNIEVTINSKTRQVFFEDNFLGIKGENLQGYLIFKFQDEFVNGVATLKVEQEGNLYNIYEVEKENDTYKVLIKSSLLKSPIIYMALSITESGSENEIPIFISNKFFMLVGDTIESTEEIPDEYNSWLDNANQKLAELDNIDVDIEENILTITKKDGSQKSQNVKGEPGTPGKDGINGTNGKDGVDGKDYVITQEDYKEIENQVKTDIQPILDEIRETSEQAEVIARGRATGYVFDTLSDLEIWLQNKNNINKLVIGDNFYIRAINVPDYWWDGTQKQELETEKPDLTNYVKNTDYATSTEVGLVKANGSSGITVNSAGNISIVKATENDINGKTNSYKPIVPSNLDYAVKSVVGDHITLTQTEYDALETKDENTYYYIVEE